MNEEAIKLIFGLKLRQHRMARKLTSSDLADKAGMSISYLNEIEKGKKYPSTEKINTLASALDVSYDRLVSLKLDKQLSPVGEILQTKLLDELPFDLFGIDKGKLIEIIANAPLKVSAFISTILHIAQSYELTQENFYFAMLRSYQEMHENYFEEIEKEAQRFRRDFNLSELEIVSSETLKNILLERFGYDVKESSFEEYPELVHIRSVYIADAKRIVINAQLAENQKAFLYGKELGYQFLSLTGERALMTPWPRATSFDQVLNNSRASYFAGSLLISPQRLAGQMEKFFALSVWSSEGLIEILKSYNSSPEMFAFRLMNVLPKYFGFQGMFFQRFDYHRSSAQVEMKKQLHLTRARGSEELDMLERFGVKWMNETVFPDLLMLGQGEVRASIQRFKTADGKSYLAIAMARTTNRNPDYSLAVVVGFEEHLAFRKKVAFAENAGISVITMALREKDLTREARFKAIESAMNRMMQEERNSAFSF